LVKEVWKRMRVKVKVRLRLIIRVFMRH
jgi:hypothetical protein